MYWRCRQTSEEMISKAKEKRERTYIPWASTSSTTETKEEGDGGGKKERAMVTSHQYILRAGKTVNYSHHSLHFSTPTVTVTMLLPCPHVRLSFTLFQQPFLSSVHYLHLAECLQVSMNYRLSMALTFGANENGKIFRLTFIDTQFTARFSAHSVSPRFSENGTSSTSFCVRNAKFTKVQNSNTASKVRIFLRSNSVKLNTCFRSQHTS